MKNKFVLSEPGLFSQVGHAEDALVRCLKKRHFFTKEGIVIMPHEKYVPKPCGALAVVTASRKSHTREQSIRP